MKDREKAQETQIPRYTFTSIENLHKQNRKPYFISKRPIKQKKKKKKKKKTTTTTTGLSKTLRHTHL
jgi:5-bromo-4-chloroindolyl phosphate hydrolysis protein